MTTETTNRQGFWKGIPAQLPMMRLKTIVEETGLSRSVVYDLIARGELPPLIKIGSRASAMPRIWLEAYIQSKCEVNVTPLQNDGGCYE